VEYPVDESSGEQKGNDAAGNCQQCDKRTASVARQVAESEMD
jgi:hypothetical protein